MEASSAFQLDVAPVNRIYGFSLTERYLVVANNRCIVHRLDCQRCQSGRGQVCPDNHADFEIGENWAVQCHAESGLMLVATRDDPGRMALWSFEDGKHVDDFIGHKQCAKCVEFLNESQFASGSSSGEIILWQRDKSEAAHVLQGHTDVITRLKAKGGLLFSGSGDRTVRIWDAASGTCIRVLEGHSNYISILTFSPDGHLLRAGSGSDGRLHIWDWRNGKLVADRKTEARQTPLYIDDGDGNMVTGGFDGSVRTWKQDGEPMTSFAAHEQPMRGLAKTGRFLVTVGTRDGRVKVWDWQNQKCLFDLMEPVRMITTAATGHGKLAVAWRDGEIADVHQIRVWDLDLIEQFASKHVG